MRALARLGCEILSSTSGRLLWGCELPMVNQIRIKASHRYSQYQNYKMDESEELLLNGLEESARKSRGQVKEGGKGSGEEALDELIRAVGGENREVLLRIQSYYTGIIQHLNTQIRDLQQQLEKNKQVLADTPQEALQSTTPYKIGRNTRYYGQQEEQSLLDQVSTEVKTNTFRNPKMAHSIVFDDDEMALPQHSTVRKYISQTDKTTLFNRKKQSYFDLQLENIKSQLHMFRSTLQSDGRTICDSPPHPLQLPLSIKLLQLEQTKNAKQHLTNQNLKLRELNRSLRLQLSSLPSELLLLKQLLQRMLCLPPDPFPLQ